ncbi:hypothetical protein [Paracoccus saliphilus]|nr:hypothetical protein [Paracoccus saliphilus]
MSDQLLLGDIEDSQEGAVDKLSITLDHIERNTDVVSEHGIPNG